MKLAWMVAVIISLSCGLAKAGNDPSFVSGTWTGTGVFQMKDKIAACPEVMMRFFRIAGQLRLCRILAQMRGAVSRRPLVTLPTTSGRTDKSIFMMSLSAKSSTTAFTSTIRSRSEAG